MNNDQLHLQRLRGHELALLLPLLPPRAKILEIGAGMGWQAKALAERGFEVAAIDLPMKLARVWPVQEYDGARIPFADHSFDVIFSSNVLEHIPHVVAFQAELQRVLKLEGFALHILPSGLWRWWTSLAYYPHLLRRALQIFSSKQGAATYEASEPQPARKNLLPALLPPRHGEIGNFMSESYWFSRARWRRLFEEAGWRVESDERSRLFYTGYALLGMEMGLSVRRGLSYVLGSACHVFCLRQKRA